MRRYVRRGSEGIALIHKDKSGKPYLEHVFDVSDTGPLSDGKRPYLWQFREEYHPAVEQALARRYGAAEYTDMGRLLMEQSLRVVNEVYREHLRDLSYDTKNSLLEDLDEFDLEARFWSLLTASVQYTVLTRCGLNPAGYLKDADLSGITAFSTPAVLHHLGDAASTVSMGLLMEIGRAVKRAEREKFTAAEKPLANQRGMEYTKGRTEFSTVNHESTERSVDHGGTDIHEGGGLFKVDPIVKTKFSTKIR